MITCIMGNIAKGPRRCRICDKTTSDKNKFGCEKWYESGTLCHTCRSRTVDSPKNNPRRSRVGGTQVYEVENPRSGVCAICGAKATTRQFDMHHAEGYDPPLEGRVELCNSCHWKETWKLKQIKHNKSGELLSKPRRRKCAMCGFMFVGMTLRKGFWYRKNSNWMCQKCYDKERRRLV